MDAFEPTKLFKYDKITLDNPRPIQGGAYFTKMIMEPNKPLYIQFPKCHTKQGIVTTKKGKYCDLMYERTDETELVEWIEQFEMKCHELIDAKKNVWFHNDLARDDIESMMTPICRLYKSGKKILVRVTIDGNKHTGKDKCVVYDEKEALLDLDLVDVERVVIPLVHIEGIKFTSRSFEVDIKLLQLMVLDPRVEPINTCMIKKNTNITPELMFSESTETVLENDETQTQDKESDDTQDKESDDTQDKESDDTQDKESDDTQDKESDDAQDKESDDAQDKESETQSSKTTLEEITDLQITNTLEEVKLDTNDLDSSIRLKRPNEVYNDIYKAARKKAKHIKQVALQAYLEAKNIKIKYMLSDTEEDSDNDSEFESIEE
jgi:hypothetical protein